MERAESLESVKGGSFGVARTKERQAKGLVEKGVGFAVAATSPEFVPFPKKNKALVHTGKRRAGVKKTCRVK